VQLGTFHTVSEAEMVRELLERNGIPSGVRGETDPIGSVTGLEPIALMVEEDDLKSARELLETYYPAADEVG
jgi:hypothetical protein